MFKIIGGIIIVMCFGVSGINKSNNLKNKYLNLKEFRSMIEELKTEIIQYNTYMPDAIKKIGQKHDNACFLKSSELIGQMGGEESFKTALLSTAKSFDFDESDISAVLSFTKGLGKYDKNNQIIRLDYAVCEIDKQIKSASEDFYKRSRLYISGSLLVGALVFILFV